MKLYRTDEEKLNSWQKRKQKNISKIKDLSLTIIPVPGFRNKEILVRHNAKGKISHSACSYCYCIVKNDPLKSGVYVFTCCKKCLSEIDVIEKSFSKKGVKKRRTKVDPSTIKIDWEFFEKLVNTDEAKLTLFSQKYKIKNDEMKTLITAKYGDKIVFKKGRKGGIKWTKNG